MKRLSIDLENGPSYELSLHEGDSNFLIIEIKGRDDDNRLCAFMNRREAEWFKKLLELQLEREDYEESE